MTSDVKPKRQKMFAMSGGNCAYCGNPIDVHTMHIDHAIPRSRGGKGNRSNSVASCPSCNLRKHNRTPDEYRQFILSQIAGMLDRLGRGQVLLGSRKLTAKSVRNGRVRFYAESDQGHFPMTWDGF